jgi:bacillithiol biosynthesis cysteine-adding enzyme BshC
MTATANASSSSVTGPPDGVRPAGGIDLTAASLPAPLAPLPAAYLAGRDRDLLAPLSFLAPGALPPPPAGPAPDRRELATGLAVANRSYGHPRADELAAKLADPATEVVVTGQQPGLLGGPFYTLVKMVAAARWATALTAAGRPAVAVFWVATEDHDWAEVSAATVGGPRTLDLGPDPEPLAPSGMRTLGAGVEAVLAGLAAAVPGEAGAAWAATVGRWFRPDARFGEAFSRLYAHLLGDRCPLLLDAMLPALKAAERPWLRALVERRREVEAAYAARDAAIEDRGYKLQVAPQRGASPLFLLQHDSQRGARRRIEWSADTEHFTLRGGDGTQSPQDIAALLAAIADNPGVVSPGVLARPAVQDAVLGSTLQVLGPGEVSYIAQAAAVYPVLGIAPPAVALRPQALILEERALAKLADAGLTLDAALGDRSALDRALADLSGGDPVAPARRQIEEALDGVAGAVLALDATLERPLAKTREQILRALDMLAEKAVAAAARRNEVAARRAEQVREAGLPSGKPQERVLATAYLAGRHPGLAERLWEQLALDPARLQVIHP